MNTPVIGTISIILSQNRDHSQQADSLKLVKGHFLLSFISNATIQDRPHQLPWNNRTELEKRLLAQTCEACGATSITDKLEVHHIRALKDLEKYDGREKPEWVKIMAARRRKTLVLCQICHRELHAGRPLRKKGITFSDGSIPMMLESAVR